jgi:hypothetical protein
MERKEEETREREIGRKERKEGQMEAEGDGRKRGMTLPLGSKVKVLPGGIGALVLMFMGKEATEQASKET